tara:strand:+ start:250 stop:507 length:258 start_codon:yes stop_codon:yes gene_type:complete
VATSAALGSCVVEELVDAEVAVEAETAVTVASALAAASLSVGEAGDAVPDSAVVAAAFVWALAAVCSWRARSVARSCGIAVAAAS